MKNGIIVIVCIAVGALTINSCGVLSGAGGTNTGVIIDPKIEDETKIILVPVGDRITYTIDISTPEGKQKLQDISLKNAKRLAETEASRKFNCDRLFDPRYDYLKKGKRILRVTVDGRPAVYRLKGK